MIHWKQLTPIKHWYHYIALLCYCYSSCMENIVLTKGIWSFLLSTLCFCKYALADMNNFHDKYTIVQSNGTKARRISAQINSFDELPVENKIYSTLTIMINVMYTKEYAALLINLLNGITRTWISRITEKYVMTTKYKWLTSAVDPITTIHKNIILYTTKCRPAKKYILSL